MTDRQTREVGRGRGGAKGPIAGWVLAVLTALALAGCGAGQDSGREQPQPERIGRVAHRDSGEEEDRGASEDTINGEAEIDTTIQAPETEKDSSAEAETEGQEDALHLGQIAISEEEEGEATELTFRIAGEVEDLPQEAQDQIARINKGEQLWEVIGSDYLKDYYALTGTHTVEAQDRDSGQEALGAGRLTLYVPNLLEGLTDIAVLFYDNAAGRWCLIPAEKVDMEKRTVSMILTGSGTLTVIHRTQGETKE